MNEATPLPLSLPVKAIVAAVLLVGVVGVIVIVVSGAPVSTIQLALAGVASTLPTLSIAATSKVCAPSLKPVNVTLVLVVVTGAPPFSV
jgi:adenine deaminase